MQKLICKIEKNFWNYSLATILKIRANVVFCYKKDKIEIFLNLIVYLKVIISL